MISENKSLELRFRCC